MNRKLGKLRMMILGTLTFLLNQTFDEETDIGRVANTGERVQLWCRISLKGKLLTLPYTLTYLLDWLIHASPPRVEPLTCTSELKLEVFIYPKYWLKFPVLAYSQLFNEIMPTIYSRFTEKEARQWRQIYKGLVLLEFVSSFFISPLWSEKRKS